MQQKLRAPFFLAPPLSLVQKWPILLFFIAFSFPLTSLASLNPGDIAIIGMNMDGPDEFSILALTDISGGEVIYFTDNGWDSNNNTFWVGESHHSWTVPSSGIPRGTVYSLTYPGALAYSGDQLLAYQGSISNPTFLTAINNSGNALWQSTAFSFASSALPPGLTDGVNAVAVKEAKSIRYNCVQYQGNRAEILAAIHNPENWLGNDLSPFTLGACSFSIANPALPSMAISVTPIAPENGNNFQIKVISDRLGNHEAGISFTGGTATLNSDFSYNNNVRASFTNSLIFTANIPFINDSDCESWETAKFALTNASGGQASNRDAELYIQDDESSIPRYYQGFENSPSDNWNYTPFPNPYNTENTGQGHIVYGTKAVYDVIKDFNTTYNATSGQFFYGMAFYPNSGSHVLDFAPIDVAGLNGGELSFRYITFNIAQLAKVQYSVAYDNGNQWSNYISLNRDNETWERVHHTIPPGVSHVRFRFRTKQTAGNICAGLDDVELRMTGCPAIPEVQLGNVPSPLCLNGPTALQVPFTSSGTFVSGNVFTVELSAANGSFANPTVIGTQAAHGYMPSGNIACILPANLLPGAGYRLRILSSQPSTTSTPSATPFTIGALSLAITSPTYSSGHHISCAGAADGSINLALPTGSAPFSYAWTGPGGFTATTQNLSNLGPGTYQVTVSDASGCTATASIALVAPQLSLNLNATDISCHAAQNGQISLTIIGSSPTFVVAWTGPGGFTSSNANLSGLAAGIYTVSVTDANGCTASAVANIAEPLLLSGSLSSPIGPCGHHISCAAANDGNINLTINGGTMPYSFAWVGPGGFTATTQNLSGIGPGAYSLTVRDARGCNFSRNIVLTAPAPISGLLTYPTFNCGFHVTCHGASDGSATLDSVSGGCPPYTFAWSNGETAPAATQLAAGNHSVTITDAKGCTKVKSFTFVEPDAISITANIRPATCQNASNGAIDLSIAGGCAPYAANWTGPFGFTASSEDLAGLYAGFYQLSLTDANGCTATFADSVSIYNDLSASLGCCQDTAICAGQTVALQVDLTGSGPWFLTWSDGLQNQVDFVLNSPHTILVSPNITTTYSLVSMSQDTTDCRGEVCGSATVAVNACDSSDCADLCVNAGVINHWDQGNCRTVVLELACDTLCNNKSAIKSTGQCFGMRTFHFNQDDSGNPLAAGTVVGSQWNALGITILVTNNNGSHPQKGVIFDSGNPTGGDADLGTPHQDFGGPGIGLGGALGALGQNDVALGNLLVIADNELDVNMDGLIDDPGDEAAGGEIRINFARPFYVESLTLVDLDNGNGFIRVAHHGSQTTDFSIPGWGDNAVTAVPIALDSVHSVRVVLPGSGGIAALAYCPLDSAPEYVDISIPCGTLSSFSNSLNLPMELIAQDSLTGLSGLRVHGLPSYCQDTAGLGPFTVTYEVCNAPCAADFCPPLLAYTRNGCTQYETARMGTVLAPPGSNSKTPLPGNGRVEVFPNPVREMATFRLLTKYDCAATLELYNLNGILVEQVWQGDLLSEKEKSIRFERGNLPIGIYILRLRTSREEGFVRKFIVVN